MALSKAANFEHTQKPVPCDTCADEIAGTYYCKDCKKTFCEECERLHSKFTTQHTTILRTEIGDIDGSILKCVDHDEQSSFYCETCDIQICCKCVTGKHKGHRINDLGEIIEKKKEALRNKTHEIEQVLPTLLKQRDEIVFKKENYEKKVIEVIKQMKEENQYLNQTLDEIYAQRIESLNSSLLDNRETFDRQATSVNSTVDLPERKVFDFENVIARNNLNDIFYFAESSDPLSDIKTEITLPQPPSFIPAKIQRLIENLGRVQIAESLKQISPTISSKFKSPLKGFPRIFVTNEGNVWLGAHESRELVLVDNQGHILKRRNIQRKPYSLAVLACGDVIISYQGDPGLVTMLLAGDREVRVFDSSPFLSYGVSVTPDQKILICISNGRVLRVDVDGSNVQCIYKTSGADSALHAVQNQDGNIYISNWEKSAVVITDKEGQILSEVKQTVSGETLQKPSGFVVDRVGNILCTDRDNHCVYIIDQNQQVRELVGRSHGIKYPRRLAVDGDNNLWITQRDGLIFVFKYLVSIS